MMNVHEKSMTFESHERQQKYVDDMKQRAPGAGIVFADAFLRGMRDIGYKNPAWALAEIIDNAIQASADIVEVGLGFQDGNKSEAKPDMLAVVDNGTGMIPEMISYAVRWGGTDRENDRSGFGRYGYGLPSAAVSLAKKYSVYSKTDSNRWHRVTVDIDRIAGVAHDAVQIEKLLTAKPSNPPKWIAPRLAKIDLGNASSGTVIVLEAIDRLKKQQGWITRKILVPKLHQHFGVIYRHWMPEHQIFVDGTQTEVVDPLFLMENGRLYDLNPYRARPVATRQFTAGGEKEEGTVRIRASLLPPQFQRKNLQEKPSSKNVNDRHTIMRHYNGLLVCREGRQIDCIPPQWTKFQNNDANLKVEIDFDAELDEYFGITTAKQQIVIDDTMWNKLRESGKNHGGLYNLIKDLRNELDALKAADKAEVEGRNEERPRTSESAMERSERFKPKRKRVNEKKAREGVENLRQEAKRVAQETGQPEHEVRERLEEETGKLRWKLEWEASEEGPFYRVKRLGDQKQVILNTSHPFYPKVYEAHADSRPSIELLLFVLADGELDVTGEAEEFYRSARARWSERLRQALSELVTDDELEDKANSVAESLYEEDAWAAEAESEITS